MPCDIEGAQPYELPDALYTGSNHSAQHVLVAILGQVPVAMGTYTSDRAGKLFSINQKFRSPPLYLQNLTILI